MPHVQFQPRPGLRPRGQGKGAPLTVLEQDVEVLARAVFEMLLPRQTQFDPHHVRGQAIEAFDARRQGFDRRFAGRTRGGSGQAQVAERPRLTEQGFARGLLGGRERVAGRPGIEGAGQHLAATGAAGAVATAMGPGDALAQGRVEQNFARFGGKGLAAGL